MRIRIDAERVIDIEKTQEIALLYHHSTQPGICGFLRKTTSGIFFIHHHKDNIIHLFKNEREAAECLLAPWNHDVSSQKQIDEILDKGVFTDKEVINMLRGEEI